MLNLSKKIETFLKKKVQKSVEACGERDQKKCSDKQLKLNELNNS